jgi:hypothetical protein
MSARARAGVCGVLGVVVALVLGTVVFAPVALAGEACPNEAVRGESALNPETQLPVSLQLPDCRGYELVTPAYKEGYHINSVPAISADGTHMIALSLGVLAGAGSGPFDSGSGDPYEFSRTGSGWTVSPLAPGSSAQFPGQELLGPVSRDLTRTLWLLQEPTDSIYSENLYVRETNGSFVEVGPLAPPAATSGPSVDTGSQIDESEGVTVLGASSDLSHVLFSIRVPLVSARQSYLWPGDTTEGKEGPSSLYEYAGTGNSHPELVGVNGSGLLISDCGTVLGAPQDKYNAVSADGETVFFTAGAKTSECANGPAVNELYARVDRSGTVSISEPSPAQCGRCLTGKPSSAEFQGASVDGSKVFFLTEQELFAGQTGMNLYEYDFHEPVTEKVVLVSGGAPGHQTQTPQVQGVVRVSADGSHVYFVAQGIFAGENAEGGAPVEGADNLYVFERDAAHPQGRTAFVATLSPGDSADWSASDARPVQATPDGRFLVFQSRALLTPDDAASRPQIFEYDAGEERLVRVTIGQCPGSLTTCAVGERFNNDGNTATGFPSFAAPFYRDQDNPAAEESASLVSTDGARVFFGSTDGLTPQALNEHLIGVFEGRRRFANNIYEYRSTGSIGNGNVYLLSDGQDVTSGENAVSDVSLVGAGASGGDVFFTSGDSLVAQDGDTQLDIYDARTGGGFPAPVSPVVCEGEACQGSPAPAPLFGSVGSAATAGGGNLPPPPVSTTTGSKPAPRSATPAQKLAKALKACRKKPRRQQALCRSQARKRYAGKSAAKTSRGRIK